MEQDDGGLANLISKLAVGDSPEPVDAPHVQVSMGTNAQYSIMFLKRRVTCVEYCRRDRARAIDRVPFFSGLLMV